MYSPKNILVTGGCGFIGSNFINYYINTYPDIVIVNLDNLQYCADKKNVIVIKNYQLVIGDLNNIELVNYILNYYNIDTVIHFAAQTHVDNSFGNSLQFTKDNVMGTHTLLECCRVYGKIQRFIHISTDEVYGEVDINHPGCNEKSILNPTNPYAATKAAAECIVRSYYYSFNLPIIITRGNNVYGPRQYPEKLIPKFINLLKNNKKCTIHGSGDTRRNFIHVDDITSAVDIILKKGTINNVYNIGTHNEYTVLDITKKIIDIINPSLVFEENVEFVDDRNFNDYRYAIDTKELIKLGWSEKIDFETGFKNTVEWYLKKII